MVAHGCGGTAS